MKRITIVAMALCLALALAVPAMALDADLSGEFRVRGFSHSAAGLDDDDASSAYYDARTRIKSVFKISDNISFTTQFDALEKVWGSSQHDITGGDTVEREDYDDNINFEHAYATIKTPIGGLLIGRLIGSQWGPSGMGDSNSNGKDRILLFVPIENWTFVAYAEKYAEYDNGTTDSDEDLDKYTALVKYKGESFEAGFLQTNYRFKNFPSLRDSLAFRGAYNDYLTKSAAATTARGTFTATYAAASAAEAAALIPAGSVNLDMTASGDNVLAAAGIPDLYDLNAAATLAEGQATAAGLGIVNGPTYVDANVWVANPYLKFDYGPFSAFGEALLVWGDADVKLAGRNDMDFDALAYHVEGKYSFGPGYVKGGYFSQTGDNNSTDDTLESIGYIEASEDLDIAFILNGSGEYHNAGLQDTLGGLGTFSGNGTTDFTARHGVTAQSGAKMIYVGVGFSPMENLDLDFVYANAKVEAPPGTKTTDPTTGAAYGTNWDDEVGSEYDFKVTWTPMDNLEYKFVCAFLDAGDYWQMGNTAADVEDNLTLYHALTISF